MSDNQKVSTWNKGRFQPPEQRFLAKVQKTDTCWLWIAGVNHFGYGYFNRSSVKKAVCVLAHRYSYELANGPIAGEMCVLHRCDNPRCVRPDHLFLGTRTDNSNDKIAKGRAAGAKGTSHPKARLTEPQVVEIRRRWENGESQMHLSREFKVGHRTVCAIVHRETWRHI